MHIYCEDSNRRQYNITCLTPSFSKPQRQKVSNLTKSLSLNRYGNIVPATLQLNNFHCLITAEYSKNRMVQRLAIFIFG